MINNERRLIVFLSGWTGQTFLWKNLQVRFRNLGYETITASYPNMGYGRIQNSAHSVAEYIKIEKDRYDKVFFIGHSMGGVIGTYAIKRGLMRPDGFVCIASPLKGTYAAELVKYLPFSQSALQMTWGSDFCSRNNSYDWPDEIPALGLQAAWDEVVIPHNSAKIDFGPNITIPRTTHITIPTNPHTFYEIWNWLSTI